MDIDAIQAIAKQATQQATDAVMPQQADIDAFTAAMNNKGADGPERALGKASEQAVGEVQKNLGDAAALAGKLMDPASMLMVQKSIAGVSVAVELSAKVAGSVSQAINKLVTMQ
ncbi:hypothetical protein EOS_35540 [Caballeronia mineralivorans PML1(12)]|uniref:EscI/YscI/HrpB family type III secretion system inner rod protein n=1 Tax=Caballeronia mineralivorans PML1(12) TaxID=908627 RepID=A0A0J1CL50_9BURK|nr:type III secretion system inner rod subunit SctI [Caballeronia mineralivorans]KLU21490.1 hypothetical protein EOS_35540 [Caballeronia mineralivorans PML1(12)]